jgi:hypothetical protein
MRLLNHGQRAVGFSNLMTVKASVVADLAQRVLQATSILITVSAYATPITSSAKAIGSAAVNSYAWSHAAQTEKLLTAGTQSLDGFNNRPTK